MRNQQELSFGKLWTLVIPLANSSWSLADSSWFSQKSENITIHFLLFIDIVNYAFYAYLRGDVPIMYIYIYMLHCLLTSEVPIIVSHYCLMMMFWKEDFSWFPMLFVIPSSLLASFGQGSLAENLKTKSKIYYSLYCSLVTIHFYYSRNSSLQIFTYLKGLVL